MSALNPHAVKSSTGGCKPWLAVVGGQFLTGPKGLLRRFKTEDAAQDAAELDAWLQGPEARQ